MAEQKYASFAPDAIKEPSNSRLWDNVDVTYTGFKFTTECPNNYRIETKPGEEPAAPLFAVIDFEIDGDSPVEERRVNEWLSCGTRAANFFSVSEDGFALVPKSADAQLYRSNFTKHVRSLVENGFPSAVVATGHFKGLLGLKAHVKRVDDPDQGMRSYKDKKTGQNKEVPRQVLLCTRVIALPGAAGAAGSGSASAAAADSTFDLDAAATEALVEVLKARNGKAVQKAQVLLHVSKYATEQPMGSAMKDNRAAIAKRAAEEDFLIDLAGMGIVAYDAAAAGKPVSLPEAA